MKHSRDEFFDETVQLQAKNERLRETLKKYGHHSTPEICCEASIKEDGRCTCGFEQALNEGGGQTDENGGSKNNANRLSGKEPGE